MFHVITVATANFYRHTRRLWSSLQKSGNPCQLTVFCDDLSTFQPLQRDGFCEVRFLPEIAALGVKRAKFSAYDIALREGGFLYLDSDIVVLQPIWELAGNKLITGCFDDLSCVSGIRDRRYPWAEDPDLENRCFINSGVFYAPAQRREFFQELKERSLDDRLWNRYILRGRIYDNSFLCAHFNLLNEPVNYVDADVYNWQGLVVRGELQVERKADALINKHNGKTLKIAHFAGVSDPDVAMCTWPVEVTSLLACMGSDDAISPKAAYVDFLGSLSSALGNPVTDPIPAKMLNLLAGETVDLIGNLRNDFTGRANYLNNPAAMVSLGYSLPYTSYRWNGLKCGDAYLDGEEYNFLQQVLQHLDINTALEIGAGETSILMRAMGIDALSIESREGPWLTRAREYGCRCSLVEFSAETLSFDEGALKAAVSRFAPTGEVDLLFIDSPSGTEARAQVVKRLTGLVRPRYILLHDALRDARVVFDAQRAFGMSLAEFLRSPRGLVLLRSQALTTEQGPSLPAFHAELRVESPQVRMELVEEESAAFASGYTNVVVRVTNLGTEPLSSRYCNPVFLSYHLLSLNNTMVLRDGLRTALPFDLLPGNSVEFRPQVELPESHADFLICFTMVQEGVMWFDEHSPQNRLVLRIGRSPEGKPTIISRQMAMAAA